MNKKSITVACILAAAALAAFIILVIWPGAEADQDIGYGNYIPMEAEADMPYESNAPRRISPSRAREIMLANPYAIILDVRTRQEFENERIPGAILLPDYAVAELAHEILPNKSAVILVYCRAGRRSRDAAQILAEKGYTNVYDFGGIESWPYERE